MNNNTLNLISAILLSCGIIFAWQHFYEKPRIAKLAQENELYQQQIANLKKQSSYNAPQIPERKEAIAGTQRVEIKSSSLAGSVSLKGLRFDDLILLGYRQQVDESSDPVELFSPGNSKEAYFAEIGWIGSDTKVPDSESIWSSDGGQLTPSTPINFTWTNEDKVKFVVTMEMDSDYMFTIKQTIVNGSQKPISVQAYGLINRNYNNKEKSVNILHQGPIGTLGGKLVERSYDDIKDKKIEKFTRSSIDWIGITDKYWLAAFIPDKSAEYSSNFNYAMKNGFDKYQVDFISQKGLIEPNASANFTHRLFAGAKKVGLLDKYEEQYNIKLFDRAIDFGWFYILTKPVFNAMNFFYIYVGNFGISILIVTIIIKLAMFALANKSYRSMKKMKNLQPAIERIKELYGDDKTRMNQEVMELYRKEKVNPIQGCLPLLVQIPVFFSIYKVLYVTIEMRHAPFFGWIKDLSAPDPTSIVNMFGLLPFTPPSFLMIGVWPIIMALTMFLQQRMSPAPADPIQAQVFKFMPLIFLVMFAGFPVGLLIYWSWNNVLSIVQQYYINKLDKSK